MKNSVLKLFFLLCAFVAGSVSALGDEAKITFANQSSGTSDSSTAYTTSTFVSSGIASSSAAFGTITCSATAKCYSGKVGYGLKAGASNSAGSFTIAFSSALANVSKITLERASYSNSKTATITVKNGTNTLANAVSTPSSSTAFSDMEITNLSITSLSGLTVETSKYCYIKSITITYSSGGSSLTTSDLAITGAPVALSFDLYNDSAAKSVSYTTSSTGAVTISGGTGYVTTSVNSGTKTITVTPTAVTPSAQTITVNQAADATYAAGSATFTVSVADSTPFAGGDVDFDATKDTGSSPLSKNGVSFSCNNGVLNNESEYRLYKNSTTTFSVSEGVIEKIIFTGVSGNPASGFGSQDGWSTDGNNGTWEGKSQSVSFVASGAQVRATKITVTYYPDGTLDPSISASNVDIAYDAINGSISYTIANAPSPAGTLTASILSGGTISGLTLGTITGSAVPFSCSVNSDNVAKTATVRLTYTYGDNDTVTKDVIITQAADPAVALDNIAALTAESAGNYKLTLTNALVTYVNGNNAYLEDASGAVILFGCAGSIDGIAAGDKYTGVANVTLTIYNSLPEVTAISLIEGYTKTTGNTVTPTVVTLATLTANYNSYLSRYIRIENARVTSAFASKNSTVEQNGTSIILRDQNSEATLTSNVNDIVTVTGHAAIYSTTKQIALYEQSQIEYVSEYVEQTYALLDFAFDGGRDDIAGIDGLSHTGLDTDYASSPKLKFKTSGNSVILRINETPGTLTFKIKGNSFSGGTFKVQVSVDGDEYTDLKSYTELGDTQTESFNNLASNVRYIKWVYSNKVSGNVALGDITLTKSPAAPASISLNAVLANGRYWTTFYNGSARYEITSGNAKAFWMNASHQLYLLGSDGTEIPAETAVIIIADGPSVTLDKKDSGSVTKPAGTILEGSDSPQLRNTVGGIPYVLGISSGALGFYKFTGSGIPANKAYYVESNN